MRILFYLLIAVSAVNAAIDTLQPDADLGKDTFVYEGMPTGNFGDSEFMSVASSSIGHTTASYFKFIELVNYFGTTISQATLELYVTTYENPGSYLTYGMIDDAWDEYDIEWGNQPWFITGTEVQETYPTGVDTWWSVDVTDTVLDWANGTYYHRGFVIFDEGDSDHAVRFATSDNPDSARWPKLILDYTGNIGVDSVSLGELKAVFK